MIEAGLGGRWDATNVIPSQVQVLTGVGLEHTRWLGPEIADIAEEKLAVVRDHATLVIGADLHPDARAVAERVAAERHARLVEAPAFADRPDTDGASLRSAGGYQRDNFALACAAAEAFLGNALDPAAVRRAAAETRVAGRMDVVAERPLTIHDGAHNPAGARALARALPEALRGASPVVGVVSVLEDKDASAMLAALLPAFDRVVFTRCANPRALSPATLAVARRARPGGRTARRSPIRRRPSPVQESLQARSGAVVVDGFDLPDRRPGPRARSCAARIEPLIRRGLLRTPGALPSTAPQAGRPVRESRHGPWGWPELRGDDRIGCRDRGNRDPRLLRRGVRHRRVFL